MSLVIIGKVRELGEGCACPLSFLTKTLLKHLELGVGQVALVDADAGVEHIGRGVEEAVDVIVAVADRSLDSLLIAGLLKDAACKLGRPYHLVVNKTTPRILPRVLRRARELGLEPSAIIGHDEELEAAALEGRPLECTAETWRSIEMLAGKVAGLLD